MMVKQFIILKKKDFTLHFTNDVYSKIISVDYKNKKTPSVKNLNLITPDIITLKSNGKISCRNCSTHGETKVKGTMMVLEDDCFFCFHCYRMMERRELI